MRKKDIEKKLRAELTEITPDVYENVVASSRIDLSRGEIKKKRSSGHSKRFVWAIATSVCLIIALVVTAGVLTLKKDNTPQSSAHYMTVTFIPSSATAAEDAENPSVALTSDSNRKIETVRAQNEGGDIIIAAMNQASERGLLGMTLTDGAAALTRAAINVGFVEAENSALVEIKVAGLGKPYEVYEAVSAAVESALTEAGITDAVLSATAYNREQLLAIISEFDSSASLDDQITVLTTKLAQRKSYVEEKIQLMTTDGKNQLAMLKLYIEKAIEEIDIVIAEIEADYSLIIGAIQPALQTLRGHAVLLQEYASNLTESLYGQVSDTVASIRSILNSLTSLGVSADIGNYVEDVPSTVDDLTRYFSEIAQRKAQRLIEENSK